MKYGSYRNLFAPVMALVALLVALVAPAAAQDNTGLPVDTITVSGIGQAFGSPDVAYVEVGVDIVDTDVAAAFSQANQTVAAVIEAVKALGVDPNDLRTTNVSLFTEIRYSPETNAESRVYHATNNVRVTVRDVSKAADVITAAVNAGANNIYGLNFSIADPTSLERDARVAAVENARARAQHLAEIMGVTLGNPIIVTERSLVEVPLFRAEAAGLGGGGLPIEQGQLSVSVQVDVTFSISR